MCPGSQQDKKSMTAVNAIGNSMEPSIKDGDLLYFKPVIDVSHVLVDDVVLCKHPYIKNLKMIKRVKKIIDGCFFVQGDNVKIFESSDSRSFGLLSPSKIIGKLN